MEVSEQTMEIRKATATDASNIAALGACVWVDTYATPGVYDNISRFIFSEFTPARMLAILQEKTVWVCSDHGSLKGYMVWGKEERGRIEIETLYVLPRCQHSGIGRQFIQTARTWPSKTFWLSVWEQNHRAIAFYLNLGFRETGELFFDLYGERIRNMVLEINT